MQLRPLKLKNMKKKKSIVTVQKEDSKTFTTLLWSRVLLRKGVFLVGFFYVKHLDTGYMF
jgi:hypothetical protein